MPTILVIDDNPAVATALELLFSLHELATEHASTPQAGLERLRAGGIDLVVQDMNFHADTTSGEDGVQLFHDIRRIDVDLPVILLTAWTRLEAAVELIRSGAADYLAKPWDDGKLMATVNTLLELSTTRRELDARTREDARRRAALACGRVLCGLVYADPASESTLALALQVAASDLPVLITGPNGAGKEKYAEILHANSSVRDGPFIALNCGAIPHELIEAELFGADTGAYTGAGKAREGKFEAADGGTLFLDEIGTLPPSGQVKLLRVLETGRFERLGSNRERRVHVRVVSATNADLRAMIAEGRFREDLYYRLDGIELRLPPLARRPRDILPLARHFLAGRKPLGEDAEHALLQHAWPGNVRELRNVMQRAELLARGPRIAAADLNLPPAVAGAQAGAPPAEEPGRDAIEAALARSGGVLAQAAAELGLSRQALYRRLDRLGIRRE